MDPRSPEAPLAVSDVDIVPEPMQDLITCVNSAPKVLSSDHMSKFWRLLKVAHRMEALVVQYLRLVKDQRDLNAV